MKNTKTLTIFVLTFGLFLSFAEFADAEPIGTAFTYQGHLYDANHVANDSYDFKFSLFDSLADGNQVGSDVNKPDIAVTDGYFTVEMDFGSGIFTGEARWLQIGVRPGDSSGAFTTLSPRQKITATPYAIYTGSAVSAANVYAGWAEEMTNASSRVTITFPPGKFDSAPDFTASALIASGTHAGEMAHITPYQVVTATDATITIQYWNGAVFDNVGDSVEVKVSYVAAEEGASVTERPIGEAGEYDGEVNSDMVEDPGANTTINFTSPFTTTAKPHFYVTVVLKHASDGLVEGAAIKAVEDIKGSAGNWTGFDLTVSKYSDGVSISDTTQVYVTWMAVRR